MTAEAEWRRDVAAKRATADASAFDDGLSAGYAGQKRKPPRAFFHAAGSWYSGFDLGAKRVALTGQAA